MYGRWPVALRRPISIFCTERLLKMIDAIAPKRIIFIGKEAMSALMPYAELIVSRDNGHFLFSRGVCRGIPAAGCRHLTGGRLRAGERVQISELLRSFAETP